jgi:hypothetical protein
MGDMVQMMRSDGEDTLADATVYAQSRAIAEFDHEFECGFDIHCAAEPLYTEQFLLGGMGMVRGLARVTIEGLAASGAEEGGLVIGKMSDLAKPTGWRSGDYTLYLPKLPAGPGRWLQNERELQNAIDLGRPIRDISPTEGGGFLERERSLLMENGWRYDPATSLWSPGG